MSLLARYKKLAETTGSKAETTKGVLAVFRKKPGLMARLYPRKHRFIHTVRYSKTGEEPVLRELAGRLRQGAFRKSILQELRRLPRIAKCDLRLTAEQWALRKKRARLLQEAILRAPVAGKALEAAALTLKKEGFCRAERTPPTCYHRFMLSRGDAPALRKALPALDIRLLGQGAVLEAVVCPSRVVHEAGETEWKNGCPVKYTRAAHEHYIRSVAHKDKKGRLCWLLDTETRVFEPPQGWQWEHDDQGWYIRRGQHDYHPTAAELLSPKWLHTVTTAAEETRRRRHLVELKNRMEATFSDFRRWAGVAVQIGDSLSAGNCRAGTENWAFSHGLAGKDRATVAELLALDSSERVKMACRAAIRRHLSTAMVRKDVCNALFQTTHSGHSP